MTTVTLLAQMSVAVASVNRANGWFDAKRDFGTDIALLHSEVSEAFEGYRNGDWDNVAEELADILIRLLDTAYRYNIDLDNEFAKKMEKNQSRGYHHGGKAV